jgi:hypothetical protein
MDTTSKSAKLKENIKELVEKKLEEFKLDLLGAIESKIEEHYSKKPRKIIKKQKVVNEKVNISKFCMEDYSYIKLTSIIKNNDDMNIVLQHIITDLYFNKDKRQNHIIKIPTEETNVISILKTLKCGNTIWKNYDFDLIIEKVIRRANDVMQHYIIGTEEDEEKVFENEIGNVKYEKLKDFTDKIDNIEDHDELKTKLIKETEATIIKKQKSIAYIE